MIFLVHCQRKANATNTFYIYCPIYAVNKTNYRLQYQHYARYVLSPSQTGDSLRSTNYKYWAIKDFREFLNFFPYVCVFLGLRHMITITFHLQTKDETEIFQRRFSLGYLIMQQNLDRLEPVCSAISVCIKHLSAFSTALPHPSLSCHIKRQVVSWWVQDAWTRMLLDISKRRSPAFSQSPFSMKFLSTNSLPLPAIADTEAWHEKYFGK